MSAALWGGAFDYGSLTVTHSFFLATEGSGDALGGDVKTAAEFHDGTVAELLHDWCETESGSTACKENGLDGSVWGQDLALTNSLPDFSGKIVSSLTLHTFEGDARVYPTEYLKEIGLELPTDLEREGYIFLGWSVKEKATSDADFVTAIAKGETGAKTFYAQWEEMKCYEIASSEALYEFADIVNQKTKGGACGKLTADIVVNTKGVLNTDGSLNSGRTDLESWTPMNVKENVKVTFNGAGHTISGLYFNDVTQDNVGFFGLVQGKLTISNLGIVDSYFKGYSLVGGLVGWGNGILTITNSYNAGSVSGNGSNVGGLVGWGNGTLSITNSYNAGFVSGSTQVGGLVGLYVGRSDYTLTITNSYNMGSVRGDSNVGGLVGSGRGGTLTITHSFFLAMGKGGDVYGGTETSLDDFHNGTVAFQLHNWCEKDGDVCKEGGLNGSVWGQDLNDANSLPDFSGVVGFKYGSITFFNLNDCVADSASIDATAKAPVSIPENIAVSKHVTFKRPFAVGYSTMMLPFSVSAENKPAELEFYRFDKVEEINGKYTASYNPVNAGSVLNAHTPYIVKNSGKDALSQVTFEGEFTLGTSGMPPPNSSSSAWKFNGTYEYKTWEEGDAGLGKTYGFAGSNGNDPSIVGKFAKVGAGAYIYPMRAYLEYTAPAALARPAANGVAASIASLPDELDVVIVDKDETSGEETTKVIGTINTRTGEFKFANDRWFDLQGRYLGSKKPTQKGAYYNNGKKVIVK